MWINWVRLGVLQYSNEYVESDWQIKWSCWVRLGVFMNMWSADWQMKWISWVRLGVFNEYVESVWQMKWICWHRLGVFNEYVESDWQIKWLCWVRLGVFNEYVESDWQIKWICWVRLGEFKDYAESMMTNDYVVRSKAGSVYIQYCINNILKMLKTTLLKVRKDKHFYSVLKWRKFMNKLGELALSCNPSYLGG